MTISAAKKTGQIKTLAATGVVTGAGILLAALVVMQGDAANGLLFLYEDLSNKWTLLFFLLVFGLAYVGGRRAGEEIIVLKKNFLWTGIKYGLLVFLVLTVYNLAVTCLVQKMLNTRLLIKLVLGNLWILIPILVSWLWAAGRIKAVKDTGN